MAKPIFKLFKARPSEAWYQLSEAERNILWEKHGEISKKIGLKYILTCDSSWDSEEFLFWGVEEFPDIEAVQGYHAELAKINWYRYFVSENLLGTRMEE
jgi:chlorite dismutase